MKENRLNYSIPFAGAIYQPGDKCQFSVWAPEKESMELHILKPVEQKLPMLKDPDGYFRLELSDIKPGARYFFVSDKGRDVPDPASYYQPDGVHGASAVVDHGSFRWNDHEWKGLPFKDLILYELHVGAFTKEGTFEAIIPRLDDLLAVGINAIELLPVSQFPGTRNWGYDGVYPYAVQHSYGGPDGLKKLVDACHQKGIAVFLDAVYNHLGPEGNYVSNYAPYFTNNYCTPWGDAINFDGNWSDGVRDFFSLNPLYWFVHYHLDGLRLDAIHMVFDNGAVHFWELANARVKQLQQQLGRPLHMIAESDLNSPKVITEPSRGGYDFTAQWLDDFHHALYVLLDKKGKERYYDFGTLEQLAKAYTDGFVHSGEYVKFRKRRHGKSSAGIPGDKFVVFNLNHDQVGNRVLGDRLCAIVDIERLKIATAALFLAPYVPMLFMGEEYADRSPFYYFVSHSDPQLIEAVRAGRKEEFKDFKSEGESPDPQDEKTFQDSKLQWHKRSSGDHALILAWHTKLIEMRKTLEALKNFNKSDIRAYVLGQAGLVLHRQTEGGTQHLLCMFNFSEHIIPYTVPVYAEHWSKILDSREQPWCTKDQDNPLMQPRISAGEHVTVPPLSVHVFSA